MKNNETNWTKFQLKKAPREGQDKLILIKPETFLRPHQLLGHFLPMDSTNCGIR